MNATNPKFQEDYQQWRFSQPLGCTTVSHGNFLAIHVYRPSTNSDLIKQLTAHSSVN